MKPEELYTVDLANTPTRVNLQTVRSKGKKVDVWIDVVGVESDAAFDWGNEARERGKRREKLATDAEKAAFDRMEQFERIAACVTAWSLDAPCTRDEVAKFFSKTHAAFYEVHNAHFDPDRFSGGPQENSSNSPSASSGSPSGPQEIKTQSANT